ncbi:MAG: hypothetical protein ACQETB_00590, partial [Halobacteriota archaeon]
MRRLRRQQEVTSLPGTVVGLGLLSAHAIGLFALGVFGAVRHGEAVLLGVGLFAVLWGVGIGIRYEWTLLRTVAEWEPVTASEGVQNGIAILAGTVLTLAGHAEFGLSPIVAAGIVGMAAAIAVPTHAVPAYCGAFVGMTSPLLFVTYWHGLIAGVLASVVFLLA